MRHERFPPSIRVSRSVYRNSERLTDVRGKYKHTTAAASPSLPLVVCGFVPFQLTEKRWKTTKQAVESVLSCPSFIVLRHTSFRCLFRDHATIVNVYAIDCGLTTKKPPNTAISSSSESSPSNDSGHRSVFYHADSRQDKTASSEITANRKKSNLPSSRLQSPQMINAHTET